MLILKRKPAIVKNKLLNKQDVKRKRAQTSKDLQRERYANMFYLSALIFGVAGVGYMSRDWDSEKEQEEMDGKNVENGYTPKINV